jgi:hypothetical protein
MFIVALLALAVAGCTGTGTPTAHPSDTTPGTIPTQTAPTATPGPKSWLEGYSEYRNTGMQQQPLVNQVDVKFEVYYHNSDWTMPQSMRTLKGNAHHGVIYKLQFTNQKAGTQSITAGDTLKSTVQYFTNGSRGYISTSEVFYDPNTDSEYGTFNIANGETRDVYMLSYFTSDAEYAAYGSHIDTVSLDLNPHYYEQF